jgi:hypothetical protein
MMNRFSREVYRPIPEVDPDILKAMKMVGTIGYAPNIGNKKRNIINYSLKRSNEKVGTMCEDVRVHCTFRTAE